MAQEAQPITVSTLPDVSRLAREVNQTGKARLVQFGGDVVRLSPVRPKRRGRTPSQTDIEASLSAAGSWKGLIDAEQLQRDLDAARGSDSSAFKRGIIVTKVTNYGTRTATTTKHVPCRADAGC